MLKISLSKSIQVKLLNIDICNINFDFIIKLKKIIKNIYITIKNEKKVRIKFW